MFLLLALLSLPAQANLGDSVAQCVARYGKPVGFSEAHPKFPFGTLVFTSTGYSLIVFLVGDKEVGARVSKVDKTGFSDSELKLIMGADSTGAGWTFTPSSDASSSSWTRGDKATALYDKTNRVLIFTSEEMARTYHARAESSAATPALPPVPDASAPIPGVLPAPRVPVAPAATPTVWPSAQPPSPSTNAPPS